MSRMSNQYQEYLDLVYSYPELVDKHANRFETVVIEQTAVDRISKWVNKYVDAKHREKRYKIDPGKMSKRALTGFCGEYAVQKFLGVNFIDWSISQSERYNKPDLDKIGIDCGIKTVEYGKFPLISQQAKTPQFFVIKKSECVFWLCGWADPKILNQYQSEDLILDPNLRKRGVKTGFYGFGHLARPMVLKLIFSLDLELI